jgi:hypothetical protein
MNALPSALQVPINTIQSLPQANVTTGTTMVEVTKEAASRGNRSQLAELAGSFIGGIIKATLGS